ncbi:OLC1v1017160C1 [Oldenlandia corymbosa var. corymbosa]|uniref:OLC1v1017160C1 n=1 Tax=Oldenlandia corymbosa var. corymbosa TaxID=529605 RepID=A0AAV1E8S9_OLDCO|nr:OLC1v1017160C1 [Oldenlandia corymbosa var. corymbosa]
MDVVKAIEKVGSTSGRTSKRVEIADCGQLNSENQVDDHVSRLPDSDHRNDHIDDHASRLPDSDHRNDSGSQKNSGGKVGSTPAIGIDLGTTYSCVGYWKHNRVEIITNDQGNRTTPSYVAFTDKEHLIGDAAFNQVALNPINTVFVVTVPAYFDHSQRQATMNAGQIAGLNVLRIINEPTAAAIAYGLDKSSSITGKRNVLIFDLGVGTFDVSILAIERSKIEVKGTAGDTHLGGGDFDARLVDHFIMVFKRKHNKDISGNPKSIRRLRTACERAKRILSSSAETRIDIDSLFEGIDFSATITRPKFEELNSDLFIKCIETVEKCLTDSQMDKNTIDDVVMVGGSSRIPKVQQMLQDLLNGKKLCRDINPDEAVAYGAVIQAATLSCQDNKKLKQLELVEITPLSLGIETSGQIMDVVIPRNTIIPARGVHELTTIVDNQSCARVKVFEGERVRSIDNKFLGEFLLPGIQLAPRGVPKIDIYFDLEANGLLTVTVKEVDTGHEKSFNVTCGRLSRDEIDSVIKEANKNQVEDKEYRKRSDARSVFEKFTCDMRDHINKSNMSSAEKKKAEDAVKNAFQWLDETHDQLAEVRDYEEKTKELARVCNPGRPSPFRQLIKLIGRNQGHQRK